MELRDHITTEKIRKKFKNQFELVNYAIKLADNMIKSGREPRVKVDVQNRSMQILEEIIRGEDRFEVIEEKIEIPVEARSEKRQPEEALVKIPSKKHRKASALLDD